MYSEEGLYFISEQLFNDLENVGAIGDTDHHKRSTLIDNIAETFKLVFKRVQDNAEIRSSEDDKFYHTSGSVMWRSLETLGPTNYMNEEYREAVIDFITFVIKSKCESGIRAKELYERCKQLQAKREG